MTVERTSDPAMAASRGRSSGVVGYEARPTRMFGAYIVYENRADGADRQVAHGDPAFCLREAERLNDALARRSLRARAAEAASNMDAATLGIRQDLEPGRWEQHRFGLSPPRWQSLAGRRLWVIGAGTGYGRAVATALAAAGASVFLTGRREAVLTEAIDAMRGLRIDPARCSAIAADITNGSAVADAARRIASASDGRLHGLVACAAVPQPRESRWPLAEMPPDAWDRLLATNVTGQWHVARAALPMMAASGTIRAVFLTSEAGWAFTPGVGPYNVSKAALNSLGASLAAETAARHPGADVQINLLDPGEARTEMNQGSTASPYAVVPMALALLTHPPGGPNGRFFHRDGRHRAFAYAGPWPRSLLDDAMVGDPSTAAGGSRDRQGIGPIRLLATGLWRKLRHD